MCRILILITFLLAHFTSAQERSQPEPNAETAKGEIRSESWFFEDFEAAGSPIAVKRISGLEASDEFRDNSRWSNSRIEYEIVEEGAFSGNQFQRVSLLEGNRHEMLKYGLPAGPGKFFEVEIALKGTPGAKARLVLSNTSDPVAGEPWMSHWSRDVELTDDWVLHRYVLPDAEVPDALRFGVQLGQPGMLDLDALRISIIPEEEAIERVRQADYVLPYEEQIVDGRFAAQPPDPWVGQYFLTPDDDLTPADVVGPDGLVYPDWRYAGIPGGIPDVPVVAYARDFGAIPDDAFEDHESIMAALEAASEAGGGAVQLEEGFYLLGQPLLIVHDNVVLRGAGMDATSLFFTYKIAPRSLTLVSHEPGEVVGYHDLIEVHADPNDLLSLEMSLNGKQIAAMNAGRHNKGNYWLKRPLFQIMRADADLAAGPATLEAKAAWADGSEAVLNTTVTLAPDERQEEGRIRFGARNPAVITFSGDRWSNRGRRWELARDLARGERVAEFRTEPQVEEGDLIVIAVPPDRGFTDRVRSGRKDIPRRCIFIVEAVNGREVTLNQPARIDYPVSQGARASTVYPIRNSGIEDLTLEQLHRHWTHGVVIDRGYLCWMRGIRVNMAGRNPVDLTGSKQCEIRDAEFNDAWYLGGGGTGYVGFTSAFDCLMEDIHTRRLRHAPNAQWASQGNVFRNSVFEQSDAQFHMGWAVENLYENCIIDAARGSGSYGYGLFVQMPEFKIHGPGGGPRNVIYYNVFTSPNSGVFLGGSNEAWMLLYNLFEVEGGAATTYPNQGDPLYVHGGPGMVFREGAFDLTVKGNHIQMRSLVQPVFYIDGEAPGIRLIDNTIASRSGVLFDGSHPPALWEGNEIITDSNPQLDRPDPVVKSIFEWQRSQ